MINCAGLYADDVARMVGDDTFEIYPRKGEFFVFQLPGGRTLDHILLPVPTKITKGVLVFPTLDGKVVCGPTAYDQSDKQDWSVRPEARDEIVDKAIGQFPELAGLEPIASYAGLRTAGRNANYVIGPSTACDALHQRGRDPVHRPDRVARHRRLRRRPAPGSRDHGRRRNRADRCARDHHAIDRAMVAADSQPMDAGVGRSRMAVGCFPDVRSSGSVP